MLRVLFSSAAQVPESVDEADAQSSHNVLVNGLDLDQSSEDELIRTLAEMVSHDGLCRLYVHVHVRMSVVLSQDVQTAGGTVDIIYMYDYVPGCNAHIMHISNMSLSIIHP